MGFAHCRETLFYFWGKWLYLDFELQIIDFFVGIGTDLCSSSGAICIPILGESYLELNVGSGIVLFNSIDGNCLALDLGVSYFRYN